MDGGNGSTENLARYDGADENDIHVHGTGKGETKLDENNIENQTMSYGLEESGNGDKTKTNDDPPNYEEAVAKQDEDTQKNTESGLEESSEKQVDLAEPYTSPLGNAELETGGIERNSEYSLAWKVLKTIFLVLVWVCLGLCGEITGPTLLDLKLRTNSNYEDVSSGVSGRSAGFFVGSALGGVLVDKFGLYCDLMLAFGLDGDAATSVSIPWMPNTDLMFMMTFLQGITEGVINIAGQKLILEMWLEKAAAPLHLLHGGYGIGSFIIPLIANPFLAVTKKLTENTTSDENVTGMPGVTMTTRIPTTTEIVVEESRMEYAYIIASMVAILVSLVFFAYHLVGGKKRRQQKEIQEKGTLETSEKRVLSFKEMINPATCAGGRFFYGVQIFIFVFLFFIQAVGGERIAGKFIRAYSIKNLDFSDDDGSYINTVFWIAFAVGRVSGLLWARFIPIRILIMLESGGCLICSVLLVIFGENSTALWVLIPAIGFFIAPLFPSGIGWANYHIEMTGVAITFFMLGGSVGGVLYMRLTGYLLDHYGYRMFLYMMLGFGIASFVISAIMNIVGAQHGSRFEAGSEDKENTTDEKNDKENYVMENKGYTPE